MHAYRIGEYLTKDFFWKLKLFMDNSSTYENTEIYNTVDSLDTCVATEFSFVEQTNGIEDYNSISLEALASLLTNNEEWQANGTVTFMKNSEVLELILYHLPSLEASAQIQF